MRIKWSRDTHCRLKPAKKALGKRLDSNAAAGAAEACEPQQLPKARSRPRTDTRRIFRGWLFFKGRYMSSEGVRRLNEWGSTVFKDWLDTVHSHQLCAVTASSEVASPNMEQSAPYQAHPELLEPQDSDRPSSGPEAARTEGTAVSPEQAPLHQSLTNVALDQVRLLHAHVSHWQGHAISAPLRHACKLLKCKGNECIAAPAYNSRCRQTVTPTASFCWVGCCELLQADF